MLVGTLSEFTAGHSDSRMIRNPVTFTRFSLRDAIDNDCVWQGRICEGDGNEADFRDVVSIDRYSCGGNFVARPAERRASRSRALLDIAQSIRPATFERARPD